MDNLAICGLDVFVSADTVSYAGANYQCYQHFAATRGGKWKHHTDGERPVRETSPPARNNYLPPSPKLKAAR